MILIPGPHYTLDTKAYGLLLDLELWGSLRCIRLKLVPVVWSTIPLETNLGNISPSQEVSQWVSIMVRSLGQGKGSKCFFDWRQVKVVFRLLRIKDLELPSGKLVVTAARLSKWRGQFLTA